MKVLVPPLPDDPLAGELDEFVRVHRLAERYRELDREPAFPRAEFRAMGEQRWLGLDRPAAQGTRGLPLTRSGHLLYRLGYRCGTAFAKLSLQPGFSSVLADHGSRDLVERYYRPLVEGKTLVANQITEPDAGSDLSRMATTAVRTGSHYLLRGTKSEAAFAKDAEAAIVYAKVEGGSAPSGISAFLVPQDLPGIHREVIDDLGERWMRRGRVTYDDVRVPADHLIGEEGRAISYVIPELARERAQLGMIYLGVARASWEETVEHAAQRIVFDRPLAEHEGVAFPLVRDWGELESTRLYVERTLERLDRGERADLDTAMAKVMATDVALRTIDHALQFHGGAGYSSALVHEQRWRDVRSGPIAHGPSEVLLRAAGRSLWRP